MTQTSTEQNSESDGNTDSSPSETVKIPESKPSANRTAARSASIKEFLAAMPTVSSSDPYYNFSVYGAGGSGKTTFACGIVRCIPETLEVLYIDVEGSHVSLLNPANPVYPYLDRIKGPFKPKNFEQLYQIIEHLSREPHNFGAIVVDTVGEIADDTAQEVLARNIKGSRTRVNPFLATEHEYRERNERMRRTFKLLRDMPVHVVLVSHEAHPDPEKGLDWRPQLSDKIRGLVINNSDLQIRLEGELKKGDEFEGVAEISVGVTANSAVKTRIMGLPPKLKNPKMEHIFAVAKPTRSAK